MKRQIGTPVLYSIFIVIIFASACKRDSGPNEPSALDPEVGSIVPEVDSGDAKVEISAGGLNPLPATGPDSITSPDSPVLNPVEDAEKADIDPEAVSDVEQSLPNGTYTVMGVGSNRCLQQQAPVGSDAPQLVQFTCNAGDAQKFVMTFVDQKYYSIKNLASGKALEVLGHAVKKLAHLQLSEYVARSDQHFFIHRLASGYFNLKPVDDQGLCVDVSFASKADNAFIQMWDQCDLPNEAWILILVPEPQ